LSRLAADKLDAAREQLEAEGWKWVEVSFDRDWSVVHGCGRIYPQPANVPAELIEQKSQAEAKLSEIEQALEADDSEELAAALDAAEATLAGIEEQLAAFAAYDPEAMRSAGCYASIGHDGTLCVEKGLVRREDQKRLVAGDDRKRKAKGLPATLRRDLEACR